MKNAMLFWFAKKPDARINQLTTLLLFVFILTLSLSCKKKKVKSGIHTLERPKVTKVKVKVLSGSGPPVKCETFITLETTGEEPNSRNFDYDVSLVFSDQNGYSIPNTAVRTFEGHDIIYAVEGVQMANDQGLRTVTVTLYNRNNPTSNDYASFDYPPSAIPPSCK